MHHRSPFRGGICFNELRKQGYSIPYFKARSDDNNPIHLTTAILSSYFDIRGFTIPDGYLCPPVPSRLDYILFIQDLLFSSAILGQHDFLYPLGVDIGTGSAAIYPILGTRVCGMKFIASDIDPVSIAYSEELIEKNSLTDSISFILNKSDEVSLLPPVGTEDKISDIDFCMCNPPFFSSLEEATSSISRANSNLSGTASELVYPGGEKKFIERLISDSINLRPEAWASSLVGIHESLDFVMTRIKSITSCTIRTTEIIQGYTRRWVVAWTRGDRNAILKEGFKTINAFEVRLLNSIFVPVQADNVTELSSTCSSGAAPPEQMGAAASLSDPSRTEECKVKEGNFVLSFESDVSLDYSKEAYEYAIERPLRIIKASGDINGILPHDLHANVEKDTRNSSRVRQSELHYSDRRRNIISCCIPLEASSVAYIQSHTSPLKIKHVKVGSNVLFAVPSATDCLHLRSVHEESLRYPSSLATVQENQSTIESLDFSLLLERIQEEFCRVDFLGKGKVLKKILSEVKEATVALAMWQTGLPFSVGWENVENGSQNSLSKNIDVISPDHRCKLWRGTLLVESGAVFSGTAPIELNIEVQLVLERRDSYPVAMLCVVLLSTNCRARDAFQYVRRFADSLRGGVLRNNKFWSKKRKREF